MEIKAHPDPLLALAFKQAEAAQVAKQDYERELQKLHAELEAWQKKALRLERQRDNLAARQLAGTHAKHKAA